MQKVEDDYRDCNQEVLYNELLQSLQPGTKWDDKITNKYAEESERIWPKQRAALMDFVHQFVSKTQFQIQKKIDSVKKE